MCCFADTHLPMPEADKPRGTTVPEFNDKTLPLRHLGSHKADDEGDVTRPLPLAMLTYQHTRGATLLHTARQGSSNAGDIWGLLSSRGTSTTSMAEINGSISGSDRRPAPLIPPRLSSVPSTTLFSGCSRGQRRQAVILPRRPAPVAVPVFPYSPTFCLLVPGVVGAAVMATQAVEGQFDDASPPPSPRLAPPPDPVAAPPAVALDAPTPWGALRTALPPANVGDAPGAPASALAIVNALSTAQVAALVAARRAAAGGVDVTAGAAGAYSASDEDSDASAGDDDASGGVLNGASDGMRGPGALPPPADEEDDEGDGAAAMEPPEPCLGLLDTCTDASVEAALTRAREMYGLDLLASLRSVTGYDRVRAVNWLRARVVREGGEGTVVAAAFKRKVAEKGGWGGDAELLPVVAGDTLIAEVLGAEEEMEGEEGEGGG